MLTENKRGNYSFVRGIAPYSAGVVADRDFEIVHVRFHRCLPLPKGFAAIRAHLTGIGRPLYALCGIELRSPKPFTFSGFIHFNTTYVEVLREWGILFDGMNPVARTNVAPAVVPPAEPSIYAFSYTIPSRSTQRTFVVAGAGELPEGSLEPNDVVRPGEHHAAAIKEKAQFVTGLMSSRLSQLGSTWRDVTATSIYTVHNILPLIEGQVLLRPGESGLHGLTWHYSRPPIESIEYEMDLRGCITELVI